MSRYFFSISFLVVLVTHSFSQELARNYLRVGWDVSKIGLRWIEPERTAWEFSVDAKLSKLLLGVVEFGINSTDIAEPDYSYSSNGLFTRLGIDYNILNQADSSYPTEIIYVGLRYANAFYKQEGKQAASDNYYWRNEVIFPKESVSTHWAEIVFGARARLMRHVYFGWTTRCRVRLFQKETMLKPYWIPGFGSSNKTITWGFNYSIFYAFPLS